MTSRDQLREQQSGLGTKQRPSRAAAQPLQLQNDATRSTKTCEQGRKAPTGAIDLKHGRSFEEESRPPVTLTGPISEPLIPLTPDAPLPAEGDDSPDAIFFRAVSEIPTQPLNRHFTPQFELDRKLRRECAFALFLVVFSLLATAILNVINQPVVTVTLLPLHKLTQMTATLPIQTRTVAPATIMRTLTAPTTGKGHQDARQASGSVTFYNGLFTSQSIPIGTVFTGADGVKVATDTAATIPPNNPPMDGQATISAHAVNIGAAGNIQAGDIDTTISNGVLVKNSQFSGGSDARNYKAVAKRDIDALTSTVQQQLTKDMPQAFVLRSGEAVYPTHCILNVTPSHQPGDEAQTVTINASQTCAGVAYDEAMLERIAPRVFNASRPGSQFERVGSVQTTIVHVTPFTVRLTGLWEYAITPDDEQYLAEQIQGDTPQQARASLFKTGLVSQVTMAKTQSLPDFYHIKFLILIGV